MPNYNRTTIVGHLTRDPEVKFFSNETALASFTVAVSEKYRGKDGDMKEETAFIDCKCWGKTAENIGKYMAKGAAILVEGKIKQDNWEDKQTGAKRSKLYLKVDLVQFLSKPGGSSEATSGNRTVADPVRYDPPAGYDDDEPPF